MRIAGTIVLLVACGVHAQGLQSGGMLGPEDPWTVGLGDSAVAARGFAAMGTPNDGRIHLFAPSSGAWLETGTVTSERWGAKGLGRSLDLDGGVLVAGAPYPFICDPEDGPTSTGEVVVFGVRGDGGLDYRQTLHHSGPDRLDRFGEAVAISGDLIVAGCKYDNDAGHSAGAAYVFRDAGGQWVEEAKLIGDLTDEGDILGWDVAIDDGRIVVGVPFRSDGGLLFSGSALVFEQVNGVWTQVARLTSPAPEAGEYFGVSVAVEGDAVLVGATGSNSAYAFERGEDGVWTFAASLAPSLGYDVGSQFNFGAKVALERGKAVVSAPHFKQGQVNVYEGASGAWTLLQKILPDDFERGDQFGSALAYTGGQLLIGARGADPTGCGMMFTDGRSGSLGQSSGQFAACEADMNRDGRVDIRDLTDFLSLWTARHDRADINADGAINTMDITMYLGMWADGCP